MNKARFTEAQVQEALAQFTENAVLAEVKPLHVGHNKDIYIYKEPEDGQDQEPSY